MGMGREGGNKEEIGVRKEERKWGGGERGPLRIRIGRG